MKNKKLLSLFVVAALSVSMIAGCGNKETVEPTQAPAPTQAAATNTPVPTKAPDPTAAPTEAPAVQPEKAPDAAYHFTFDEGVDEGIIAVERTDTLVMYGEPTKALTGATYGMADTAHPIQYSNGPVNGCLYLDGKYGVKLPVTDLGTDTYTISYWMNASRLSTYGATLQIGRNIGMADTDPAVPVTWMNLTQSEWGTNSAKIFPVVWNRNSAKDVFPWVYAADDSIHGKKEWIMVTVVCSGENYTYSTDGTPRVGMKFYINGEVAFDASANLDLYGGLAPEILMGEGVEAWLGINYWDSLYKGYFDDMYIFKEALTDGQVLSLFQLGDKNVNTVEPEKWEAPEGTDEPVVQIQEVLSYCFGVDSSYNVIKGKQIGASDFSSGWWSEFSDVWAVPVGETITKKLTTFHGDAAANNWNNFAVVLQNVPAGHSAADFKGYAEYAVVRPDNYGWGAGYDAEGLVKECDWNWDTMAADINGAACEVSVTNVDGATANVVITATTADGSKTYTQKYLGIGITGDLNFCFGIDSSYIVLADEQIGASDFSSGWWSEFSTPVTVLPGTTSTQTLTTFHGDAAANNWNNFALILQSTPSGHAATTAGYREYAVVRPDNYGWGNGYEVCTHETDWNFDTMAADINGATVVITVTNNNNETADVKMEFTTADGRTFFQTYTGLSLGPVVE